MRNLLNQLLIYIGYVDLNVRTNVADFIYNNILL